jgi:hypothetical protein
LGLLLLLVVFCRGFGFVVGFAPNVLEKNKSNNKATAMSFAKSGPG